MKVLVIYDSIFGNTKRIAQKLGEATGGKVVAVSSFKPEMLIGIDLVIVGSPVYSNHPSEQTSKFLKNLPKNILVGKYIAAFDTGYHNNVGDTASNKIRQALENAGGTALMASYSFKVVQMIGPLGPDELVSASQWGQALMAHLCTTPQIC